MKRLFGTDGIRAVAGDAPLDPVTVRKFGAALADVLGHGEQNDATVVLGRDTRESGPWLRDAVTAGLASRGVRRVHRLGATCGIRRESGLNRNGSSSASCVGG